MRKLTPKQERFANEYVIDLNGAQAATRAGYSARTATEKAYVLLRIPEIADLVERLIAERAVLTGMEQQQVINELAHLGFSSVDHYTVDPDTGELRLTECAPLGAMAAVQSVKQRKRVSRGVTIYETELTLWDKPKALLLLGRHVGLFPNRVEHTGPNGAPLESITTIERLLISLPSGSLARKPHTEHDRAIPAADHPLTGDVTTLKE
jgi:phage terminase small subunit